MQIIKWDPSFSVQNAEMDKQHQRLFDLINDLHEAMGQGKGREALPKVLDELVQYTKTHFASEEGLLQKNGYPEFNIHKNLHTDLINQVARLQDKFQSGDFSASQQTRDFLKQWLVDHIKGHDQKYGAYLAKKGVN